MTASLPICTRSTLWPADVFLCNFLTDSPVKDEWRVLLQVCRQRLAWVLGRCCRKHALAPSNLLHSV